jgi:hypothetical protein
MLPHVRHYSEEIAKDGDSILILRFSGIFGISVDFLRAMNGSFFLRRKPLKCAVSLDSIPKMP